MKSFLTIAFIFTFLLKATSQQTDFIDLIFKDTANLSICKEYEQHDLPTKIYLLSRKDLWDPRRFKLIEVHNSYSEGGDPYLFFDSSLSTLFTAEEKDYFFKQTKDSSALTVFKPGNNIQIINSLNGFKSGFLFSLTNPIFSPGNKYAFIQMISYFKQPAEKEFRNTYIGDTIFLFQYASKTGWTLIKKREHLYL